MWKSEQLLSSPRFEKLINNAELDQPLEYIRIVCEALRQAAQGLTECVGGNALSILQ
jgi:hypothetical protein